MSPKILALAILASAAASGAQAAYLPDNNGHYVYVDDGHPQSSARSKPAVRRTARSHASRRSKARQVQDANGNRVSGIVRSAKTGAVAYVAPEYAAKFQAYINDIEATGARILSMGGYRRGQCAPWSQHPCGKALDLCQLSRGVVDARCHLPGKVTVTALAMKHGLFEGALWCDSDYGHAQVTLSAGPCRRNLYAAAQKFKDSMASARTASVDGEALAYDYSLVNLVDAKDPDVRLSAKTRTKHRHTRTARRHYKRET